MTTPNGTTSAAPDGALISLQLVLKLSFFSGVFGSLILSPVILIGEFLFFGAATLFANGIVVTSISIVLGSIVTGIALFVLGLVSYPLIRALADRGYIRF